MVGKVKQFLKSWQDERRRQRFLHEKLEQLVDPTFLDRVLADER